MEVASIDDTREWRQKFHLRFRCGERKGGKGIGKRRDGEGAKIGENGK
jgi:hypothetical protein